MEEAFDEPDEPAAAADEPDADDEPEALDSEAEEACDASEADEPPATADEALETAEETAPPLAADELSAALTAITARENTAVDVNFIIIILTIVIVVS